MKTNTQIKIDRSIGIFNLLLINPIVRILGKILKINHDLNNNFKTIAVCKYKGMGSIIQSTLLLQALRDKFPESRIIFVSTKSNQGILNKINIIDEQLLLDDGGIFKLMTSSFCLLLRCWKRKIDVYIDLEVYSNFSSLITTLSIAKNRIGFYRQASQYRMGIYTHMMFYNIKAPISHVYLQMAFLLNCNSLNNHLFAIDTDLSKHELEHQFKMLKDIRYIIINPNASDLRIERRWHSDNFIALINKMIQSHPDIKIILIGAKNEKPYVDNVFKNINNSENLFNLAGKTNLDELIALVKYSDLLITNDSGPMHLAFALKVKTLALFGPCSPNQYGDNDNCSVVYKNVYCSPCIHEFDIPPCKGNNYCMQSIDIEIVYESIEANLFSTDVIKKNIDRPILYRNNQKNITFGLSLR